MPWLLMYLRVFLRGDNSSFSKRRVSSRSESFSNLINLAISVSSFPACGVLWVLGEGYRLIPRRILMRSNALFWASFWAGKSGELDRGGAVN